MPVFNFSLAPSPGCAIRQIPDRSIPQVAAKIVMIYLVLQLTMCSGEATTPGLPIQHFTLGAAFLQLLGKLKCCLARATLLTIGKIKRSDGEWIFLRLLWLVQVAIRPIGCPGVSIITMEPTLK